MNVIHDLLLVVGAITITVIVVGTLIYCWHWLYETGKSVHWRNRADRFEKENSSLRAEIEELRKNRSPFR